MGRKLTNSGRRYSYLTSEIEALYHEAAQKFELSDSALRILYTICLVGDVCPLSETIRLSGISKQTVNSSLRNLEKHGALYLKTAGGKKKNIYLTEKGQALVEQSAMQVIKIENAILSSWTQADQNAYIELTERFLSEFRKKVRRLTV